MKFPRSVRISRSYFDVAPYTGVFFLLVIFVMLTRLYTPGIHIRLPMSTPTELVGVNGPTLAIAVGRDGQYYFGNELLSERELKLRLKIAAQNSPQPLTLVLLADREASYGTCVRLAGLVQEAGIRDILWQTLPRIFDGSPINTSRP